MASKSSSEPSALKKYYLALYNFVSAVAWLTVLGRVVMLATMRGPSFVALGVADWTKWTQTMAGMEILHAALGTFLLRLLPSSSLVVGSGAARMCVPASPTRMRSGDTFGAGAEEERDREFRSANVCPLWGGGGKRRDRARAHCYH